MTVGGDRERGKLGGHPFSYLTRNELLDPRFRARCGRRHGGLNASARLWFASSVFGCYYFENCSAVLSVAGRGGAGGRAGTVFFSSVWRANTTV